MSDDDFAFDIEAAGDRTVIRLRGEVDMANATDLADALGTAADLGRPVVIDVSELSFIDSAGFAAIHRSIERVRVHLVVPATTRTARAFAVSGLDSVLPVVRSLDEVQIDDEV